MAAKAKEARDEWEIKLITALEELELVSGTAPVNKRVVELKVQSVEDIFEKLQRIHAQYCQKAKIGLGSAESTEFIKGQTRLKVKGITEARAALTNGEDDTEIREFEARVKLENFQLKVDIEGKLTSLQAMSSTALLTTLQYSSTMEMLSDCEAKLQKYMEGAAQIARGGNEEESKKVNEECQDFFKQKNTKLNELKCTYLAKAPIKTESTSQPQPQPIAPSQSFDNSASKHPVKIKSMDCPTWDGKYRTFPRFKKMWDENITPRHQDSALHFLLCQSLPKSILDNISTLSDSAEDIWKYLDDKYGKPDVVAREVMGELMALDHNKLGQRFMCKFVTLLLDTETLLKSINEIEWLVSNRSVAELEDMLPQSEKLEWAKKMGSTDGDTKYQKFKNFLIGRKKILENMDMIGCKPVGGRAEKCSYCNKGGHTEDVCFSKKRDQKNGDSKFKGGCAICKADDHWKNECPQRGTNKDKQKNNKNATKAKNQGDSLNADIGSNTLHTLDCQRCKNSGKLISCPGCKQTSSISHCLLHCEGYMVLSVKDRVDMVKSAKFCAICLHPSHTTEKCFNKDKDSHICGVNGCSSHHHPSLHGSKDIYVTGVNALLSQGHQALTTTGVPSHISIDDWASRIKFLDDSYPAELNAMIDLNPNSSRTTREAELREVKAELAKPLIHGEKVLMVMQNIPAVYGKDGNISEVTSFFDDGSTCSAIKNEVAQKLELYGDPVLLELGTVNATTLLETKLYCIELLDMSGNRHIIKAFGLESLSGKLPSMTLDGIEHEFSDIVKNNWEIFFKTYRRGRTFNWE